MKTLRTLSFIWLLSFLAFTILHVTNAPTHPHPIDKAVFFLDDWKLASNGEEEEKHLFFPPVFIEALFHIAAIATILSYLSSCVKRSIIFLTPVFHQSNYVIVSPKM
nr:hypothetical protein [Neobacillus sp. Marseille-Q6967]